MKKQFIRNRKMRYGSITVILTVLVLTVTILANAVVESLAARYHWYTDMNEVGLFEVTDDCYAFLETVFTSRKEEGEDPKVEIIFCDLPENIEEEPTQTQLYHTAISLQTRFSDYIKVTCHDILSNPNTVRDYATTVDPHTGAVEPIAITTTDVVVVSEGYHRVYKLSEFFSFKDNDFSNLWGYNGERKLAAGLMRAASPNRPTACLTNNHGEVYHDYSILYLLDDAGYNVTYLDLYKEAIPADCSLIVTYNPTSDMVVDELSTVSEREVLDRFLEKEGNGYWIYLDYTSPAMKNFEAFLADWGTAFSYHQAKSKQYRYMVKDSSQSLTSDGYTIYAEAAKEGEAAKILGDASRTVIFKNATAMKPASGFVNNGDGSFTKGDRVMYSLYTGGASATSWANGNPVDEADSAILMSLTERTLANGKSFVGVVSSAEFATESFLDSAVYGNADTVCMLAERQGIQNTPAGLTTKPYAQTEISTVTTRQMLIWTIALSVTPAVVVTAIALVVLLKRRRA